MVTTLRLQVVSMGAARDIAWEGVAVLLGVRSLSLVPVTFMEGLIGLVTLVAIFRLDLPPPIRDTQALRQ